MTKRFKIKQLVLNFLVLMFSFSLGSKIWATEIMPNTHGAVRLPDQYLWAGHGIGIFLIFIGAGLVIWAGCICNKKCS